MPHQLHFNLGRVPFACALDDNGFPPFLKELRIQMDGSCESEPKQHGRSPKASQFQGSPTFASPAGIIAPPWITPSLYLSI